jgi:Zn-dependent alcohol dehydrogenase
MPLRNQPSHGREVLVHEPSRNAKTFAEISHRWHGRLPEVPFPIIPGHTNVGVLEKLRGEILDLEGEPFREGDLVTFLDVHETCGRCWYCLWQCSPD